MSRQTIVLIFLVLFAAARGASANTDSHAAWQSVGPVPPAINVPVVADKFITALAMDPDSPDTVFVATFLRSVYKTVTGGR